MKYKLLHLFLLVCFPVVLLAQNKKHSFYILNNYNISIESTIYLFFPDPNYDLWSRPENRFSYEIGYTNHLNDFIGIGLHAESERIRFTDIYFGDNATAFRLAIGSHFVATYPQTKLHAISGGFLNFGGLNSQDFDKKILGIEYGIFFGPEYWIKKFGLSVLFHPKFSYYTSNDGEPESGLLMYPRVSLKLSYSINL